MAITQILSKAKVGPITLTSANFLVKGGLSGNFNFVFDIAATDLAKEGTLLDVKLEEWDPAISDWYEISHKVVTGPWTKAAKPSMGISWNNDPSGGTAVPDRNMRVTVSIPQRITIGVTVTH